MLQFKTQKWHINHIIIINIYNKKTITRTRYKKIHAKKKTQQQQQTKL